MNRVWTTTFLALGLFACPKRIDFGPQGPLSDPQELLRRVEAAEAKAYAVRGEAKLKVDVPDMKGVVTLFVSVMQPALLHVESLDFFGKPQAILVSNAQSFGLFHAQDGKFYRGPPSPAALARVLPLAIAPDQLVALLLGRAPKLMAPEQSALFVDAARGLYRLELRKGAMLQTLWVHPESYRVVETRIEGGDEPLELRFDQFEAAGDGRYPRRVQLSLPKSERKLELSYRDVAVNPAPDLTDFELEPPPNVPVVEVDAQGNPVNGS